MTLFIPFEHFPYLGLFILLIMGGIGLPVPEDSTLILCGFLISNRVVKPIPAVLTVYAGLLIADLLLHLIGRKFGRQIVTHPRFQKWLSQERLSFLEEKFNRQGILFILLGRHLAGLRAQIFLVSGVLRMSTVKFFLVDAFSSLLTMSLMIGAGYLGGNSLEALKRDLSRIEHGAIVLLLLALIGFALYKFYFSRQR